MYLRVSQVNSSLPNFLSLPIPEFIDSSRFRVGRLRHMVHVTLVLSKSRPVRTPQVQRTAMFQLAPFHAAQRARGRPRYLHSVPFRPLYAFPTHCRPAQLSLDSNAGLLARVLSPAARLHEIIYPICALRFAAVSHPVEPNASSSSVAAAMGSRLLISLDEELSRRIQNAVVEIDWSAKECTAQRRLDSAGTGSGVGRWLAGARREDQIGIQPGLSQRHVVGQLHCFANLLPLVLEQATIQSLQASETSLRRLLFK
ncbi:hypothetical protein C8R45DRAFT_1077289 [Mycena sanguinolenta]|nr:hypothetical protein C8R45DRAFT_1077289 [Mycena sanguinolenta]